MALQSSSGNVGIGTVSPSEKLQVAGRITLDQIAAPATTTDKLYNVSGNLFWNAVNLSGGGALPVGTEGQMLYNNAGSWAAFSDMYWDDGGGNLGIGTTDPGEKFDVAGGDVRTDADFHGGDLYLGYDDTSATLTTTDTDENLTLDSNGAGDIYFNGATYYIDDSSLAYLSGLATTGYTPTAGEVRADVFRDGDSGYYIQPADTTISGYFAGNVGIGVTPGTFVLEIDGSIGPDSNDDHDLGSDTRRWQDIYLGPASIHIGTSTADEYTISYDTGSDFLGFNVNGTGNPEIIFNSSGNVGIGFTNPGAKLEIVADGGIKVGNTNWIGVSSDTERISFDAGNDRILLHWDGTNALKVGIGTTAPGSALEVNGDITVGGDDWIGIGVSDERIVFDASNNQIEIEGAKVGIGTTGTLTHQIEVVGTAGLSTGTAWTNTSDSRFKNIESELTGSSLDVVMALNPVSFTWNELHTNKYGEDPGLNYGFIAQEVEQVIPEFITQDAEGYYFYNPSGIEAILTAAVQEQQVMLTDLQSAVDSSQLTIDREIENNNIARLQTEVAGLSEKLEVLIQDEGGEPEPAVGVLTDIQGELVVREAAEFKGKLTVLADATFKGKLYLENGVEVKGDLVVDGAIAVEFTAGEDLAGGDAVYISSADTVSKASAVSEDRMPAIGMAVSGASEGAVVKVAVGGTVKGLSGLSIGKRYYVTAGGGISAGAPQTVGYVVQIIGVAKNESELLVMPGLGYEVVVQETFEEEKEGIGEEGAGDKLSEDKGNVGSGAVGTGTVGSGATPSPTPTPTPTPTPSPDAVDEGTGDEEDKLSEDKGNVGSGAVGTGALGDE